MCVFKDLEFNTYIANDTFWFINLGEMLSQWARQMTRHGKFILLIANCML